MKIKISPIRYLKSAYRARRPIRTIKEIGYSKNYFMQESPLSEGYQRPTRFKRICKKIEDFFVNYFDN